MAEAKLGIPVFLPGNNRDWDEIAGVMTVSDTGRIELQLKTPEHGMKIVEMMNAGKLIAVSFDYVPEKTDG